MPPKVKVPPNAKFQPQDPKLVNNDTGSTDPKDLRARLFVGCLNLESCNRNDVIELFSMYGPIKGVTHFAKGGYAFVQFESIQDAEDAVLNLNRYMFQGIRLDVKFAQKDKNHPTPNANRGGFSGNVQRGGRGAPSLARKRGNEAGPSSSFGNWSKQARYGSNNAEEFNEDDYNQPPYQENYNEDYADEGYDEEDANEHRSTGYFDPYSAQQQTRFGKAAQKANKPTQQQDKENKNDEENGNEEDSNDAEIVAETEETSPEKLAESEKAKEAKELLRQKRVEQIKTQIFENIEDEEGSVLDQNEIPDIMICGGCHLITSSADFFYGHRLRPCDRKLTNKHEDEPKTFSCFHCGEKLTTSWELLFHLNRKHKICLYKEPDEPQTIEYAPLYAD